MSILASIELKNILLKRRIANKEVALRELSLQAAASSGLAVEAINQALQRREQLGSTGIGSGIAIPHARLPELAKDVGLLMTLEPAIDFASIDRKPVDLIFLLLSAGSNGDHLQQLASISRLLRDPEQTGILRAATDPAAVLQALKARSC